MAKISPGIASGHAQKMIARIEAISQSKTLGANQTQRVVQSRNVRLGNLVVEAVVRAVPVDPQGGRSVGGGYSLFP